MKCPKCSLVTFDHLSKCPRCKQTFDLSRRLTRRRTNPHRRIVLSSSAPSEEAAPRPVVQTPDEAPLEAPRGTTPSVGSAVTESAEPQSSETPPAATGSPSPSLQALAESELADDVAVNVSDAVKAVREAVREDTPTREASAEPGNLAAEESPTAGTDDSKTIKDRMVRASRARRKQRPDLVTEAIDPVLPDWYEPDLDEADGATSSNGKSVSRG